MKVASEKEFRQKLLNRAFMIGGEMARHDIAAIFDKFDKALKTCTSEFERQSIAKMGASEIHKYFYCAGELVVDGEQVLPADKDFINNSVESGKIIKL